MHNPKVCMEFGVYTYSNANATHATTQDSVDTNTQLRLRLPRLAAALEEEERRRRNRTTDRARRPRLAARRRKEEEGGRKKRQHARRLRRSVVVVDKPLQTMLWHNERRMHYGS